MDVPNLIKEARNRLDDEGHHLEYDDRSGGGRIVEIHTTKSVGANTPLFNSMLVMPAITQAKSMGNHEQSNGNHTPRANKLPQRTSCKSMLIEQHF